MNGPMAAGCRLLSSIATLPIARVSIRAHIWPSSGAFCRRLFRLRSALRERQWATGQATEVACWAHVRRKFYDIHVATSAPIAGEALQRIGQLFDIERAAMARLLTSDGGFVNSEHVPSSMTLPRSSMPRSRRSPAGVNWPVRSVTHVRAGVRSRHSG